MVQIGPHALFQTLSQDIFDAHPSARPGSFWPGISDGEAACVSLLNSILKKYEDSNDVAVRAAIEDFVQCNNEMENHRALFMSSKQSFDSLDDLIINETFARFYDSLNAPHRDGTISFDLSRICLNMDVGPGASVDASGGSLYHKLFSSQITCTSLELVRLFKAYASLNPTLDAALKLAEQEFGPVKIVRGSTLGTVPKNTTIARAICTEPSLNMMFQQGLRSELEGILYRDYGIDMSFQPVIQAHLARVGSINGVICTIDATSASNRIPNWIFKAPYTPPHVSEWVQCARSPSCDIPGKGWTPLHMVSSMGNAFTFPFMTLLLCSLISACYAVFDIPLCRPKVVRREGVDNRLVDPGNFGVFGDDVAIDRRVYDRFCRCAEYLGFKINLSKSFKDEDFRESCGHDYIRGYEIRGVYCKSLQSQQDRLTLLNNLTLWSCNHGIRLTRTVRLLAGSVEFLPVPAFENDDAGVRVPFDYFDPRSLPERTEFGSFAYRRWSAKSHRIPYEMIGRYRGQKPRVISKHYKDLYGKTPPRAVVKHLRHLAGNPLGLLICASKGILRGGWLSLRNDNPSYAKTLEVAPCWDYVHRSSSRFSDVGWSNWVTGWINEDLRLV